jgi:hypothetical protein
VKVGSARSDGRLGAESVLGQGSGDLKVPTTVPDLSRPARAADDALRDLVDKYGDGSEDGIGSTFGHLLDEWLEDSERLELSPTTLRT